MEEWANLPDSLSYPVESRRDDSGWRNSVKRLTSHYPQVFNFIKDHERELDLLVAEGQNWLRRAWIERDPVRRDWYLFIARYTYHNKRVALELAGGFPDKVEATRFFSTMIPQLPEEITLLDAAIRYMQTRLSHRTLCCPHSECPARYFFRRRRGQKYCSVACERPSRKKQKRRYWNESPTSPRNRSKKASSRQG